MLEAWQILFPRSQEGKLKPSGAMGLFLGTCLVPTVSSCASMCDCALQPHPAAGLLPSWQVAPLSLAV